MIEILNPTRLARARDTGALVADILQALKSRSTVGTSRRSAHGWSGVMAGLTSTDPADTSGSPSPSSHRSASGRPRTARQVSATAAAPASSTAGSPAYQVTQRRDCSA